MTNGFDPRQHSAVSLCLSERQPTTHGTWSPNTALKSYMVGPNCPDKVSTLLHRPNTSPPGAQIAYRMQAPQYSSLSAVKTVRRNSAAHPRFLDADGQWVKTKIPHLIAESPAQELCATDKMSASITAKHQGGEVRQVKPLTAVHTYNDISPGTTAEHVRDGPDSDPVTTQRINPHLNSSTSTRSDNALSPTSKIERSEFTLRATPVGSTEKRVNSINEFWNRTNGAFNLKKGDLDRVEEMARNSVPGSPNCKLISGRWKYLARPVDGDVLYTDYYGRFGEEHCNYYGRKYNLSAQEFYNGSIIGDSEYLRVQASMQGIHKLRNRAGLTMNSTIASAVPSSKLNNVSPYAVDQRGIHRINLTARLRPELKTR